MVASLGDTIGVSFMVVARSSSVPVAMMNGGKVELGAMEHEDENGEKGPPCF
jgi:hypothetical protein